MAYMEWNALVDEAWWNGASLLRLRELVAKNQAMAWIVASRIDLSPEPAEELVNHADGNTTREAADTAVDEAALRVLPALAARRTTWPCVIQPEVMA